MSRLQTITRIQLPSTLPSILNSFVMMVGNGSSKPVVKNDTEKHRAMNRRTDVSFKIIESN